MRFVFSTILFIIGITVGWVSHRHHELDKFNSLIADSGMSREQIISAWQSLPVITSNIEQDHQLAALIAVQSLRCLEENYPEKAKKLLAGCAASYYVIYGPQGNPKKSISKEIEKVLLLIEENRKRIPELDQAVEKSLQNIKK